MLLSVATTALVVIFKDCGIGTAPRNQVSQQWRNAEVDPARSVPGDKMSTDLYGGEGEGLVKTEPAETKVRILLRLDPTHNAVPLSS